MALCAVAQAAAGLTGEAYGLIEELRRSRPKDTMINELWIPTANAATALQADKPKEALEHLRATERYEWAGRFVPIYLRGLALEKSGLSANAAIEFQKMIDHRGISPLSALYPLAHYGKARQSSDPVDYEMFFELWKEADDDMPALVEARRQFEDIDRQD